MGLFTRFTDIVNANINSMLDKAEQPEKMIRLIIQEMEETLVEVRAAAAKNIADQKTHARRLKSVQATVEHWHIKATLALTKDREDLAKLALSQKHKYQQDLTILEQEGEQIAECLHKIQEDSGRLQEKLSEAKRRQKTLLLRQESAQVRLKLREKEENYSIETALHKFECYQQKIDRVEAQVEAYELTQCTHHKHSLEAEFAALAEADSIKQDLQKMKKQMANA